MKNKPILPVLAAFMGVALLAAGWYVSRPVDQSLEPAPAVPAAETVLNNAAAQTEQAAHVAPAAPKPMPTIAPTGRFIGRADAPVQIIEFASLTCSHCAAFHTQTLDALRVALVDTGKARIEFRPFPLNKPALDATKILNCLPDGQFYPFMTVLFETQDHWAYSNDYLVSLKQNAKLAGMSDAAFDACLSDKTAETKLLEQIQSDSEKYKIESTPSFVIVPTIAQTELTPDQMKLVGNRPVPDFAARVDALLTHKTETTPTTETPAP
jgi:protein-disulfide isomerase